MSSIIRNYLANIFEIGQTACMTTKDTCNKGDAATSFPPPTPLTPAQFLSWISDRLSQGESKAAIGRSLGVTHEAVRQWLSGGRASATTLLLATYVMGGTSAGNPQVIGAAGSARPIDLPDGFPVGDDGP